MTDVKFPILGIGIPPMVGRADLMQWLWNNLTKKSPSNLSIVGPRYVGKTVLMNNLAERMRQPDSPYNAVVFWDLGHQTPDSDHAFLKSFCHKLGQELAVIGNEYAEHILALQEEEGIYEELKEIIDAMHSDKIKTLMVWDGFDQPLNKDNLTRNHWDNLRELFSKTTSLRLVTATRQPMSELLRSTTTASSDFWNIFDPTPLQVGIFDAQDIVALMSKVPDLTFTSGAMSELQNWTAGYPILYLFLINQIVKTRATGDIDNQIVNQVAEAISGSVNSYISFLWKDCPASAKEAYRYLIEHKKVDAADINSVDRKCLEEKGFIKVTGNKIESGCRFAEQYVKQNGDNIGNMARLFRFWKDYQENIRSVLEFRLDHLVSLNADLRRLIQKSIEDIPEHPRVCLTNIRGVVDRALDLIWDAEFGTGRAVPEAWFTEWKYNGEKGPQDYWDKKFPFAKRGHQIHLLKLITGTDKSDSKAKHISSNTWALANSAHGFGDFGQHLPPGDIPVGVAIAAVNTCLELAACLESELGGINPVNA
ncbi:P-loop domain-containing protein [Desulfosudis oleivorans]|uniref:Nephrocystin 3-like N-terminal domain-containing protein n=1 Tax=Desulfosudis oleivorans (strain DSM 6200 / JCM 39069 / Hxd3) TaxID=96561 RepID=A8ZY61_DESOH|nr:AAA-like domain-containing protein [Desulfosudis oleivorans]ABW67068.1 hypothetical protein Dole_1262 [Desulfosudis oleivorans Hxd3]